MTEPWYYQEAETPSQFPWPPPENGPVLAAFGDTWRSATFEPTSLFARIPHEGGSGPAVLYYLILGILLAGANLFWETLTGGRETGLAPGAEFQPVMFFLLSPILLLLGLVISAAVIHVMLLLVRGATHSFGTSLRVLCYAYSPMIFGVIPLLGTVVGGVWMLVITVLGLAAAHETERWKAALAVLLPFLLALGLLMVAIMMLIAAGALILP